MASDEIELVDCLEQLNYLLLFFDVEPKTVLDFARTYDAAAKHVYGEPLPRPATRKPGRLRIGYLSADLRESRHGKDDVAGRPASRSFPLRDQFLFAGARRG